MSLGPRTVVGLLVALNLSAGGVAAVALDRSFVRASDAPRPKHAEHFFDHLKRELGLDEQQTERVRAILDARRPECRRIIQESADRLDAFRHETDLELAKVLRPDQVARLAEVRRQRDAEARANTERARGDDARK
jgi:hypothetical protein